MDFTEFRSIVGKQVFDSLSIRNNQQLSGGIQKLEDYFQSLDNQSRATLVENLLGAASISDSSVYYYLQEAVTTGNFISAFYLQCMTSNDKKNTAAAHTIKYADFTRTIATLFFDEERYDSLFSHDYSPCHKAIRSKTAYATLLDEMLLAFHEKTPSARDVIINTMLSFVDSLDDGYQLMRYYKNGSDESMHDFFDYWLRAVVPTAAKKAPPFEKEKLLAAPSPEDLELYKRIQLAEILGILSFGSTELRKMLGIEDIPFAISGQQRVTWKIYKPLLDFFTFHEILCRAIPGYKDTIENDLIKYEPDRKKPMKWSTLKRYKAGQSRADSSSVRKICETYLTLLVENHTDAIAEKIIWEISKIDFESALLLIQSHVNNKDNPREFYTNLLSRVRNFNNYFGEYDTLQVNESVLLFHEKGFYGTLQKIIQYQDKSFQEPLFHDERDDFLTYNTFEELNRVLLHYFAHPRLILDPELRNVEYWIGDTLDKHMFKKESDLYALLPALTTTFLWNKNISIEDVTPDDIRELNGAGYSLTLAQSDDVSYLNIGYRMMSSARDLYHSIKDTLDPATDKMLKALIHSNLATCFLQKSFKTKNLYEERVCLDIARAYDTVALETRKALLDECTDSGEKSLEEIINAKEKVALSEQNFGTSCYYSGRYFDTNKLSPVDARSNYLESIKHNLTSVQIYMETSNKSDHIIRGSIKVFGSSKAYKQSTGAFASPAELGYSGEEEKLCVLLDRCITTLEELDHDYIYIEPEELEADRLLCADMKAAITAGRD